MIDIVCDDGVVTMVEAADIQDVVRRICAEELGDEGIEPEVCIRFADDASVKDLNAQWRGKDTVTDVLSFPMQEGAIDPSESLGDMVLAAAFVAKEAQRLHVSVAAHSLHLVIHGTLHLLGYDHVADDEASIMQKKEQYWMRVLGLHNPYPAEDEE